MSEIQTKAHVTQDGEIVFERHQDCQPALDYVAQLKTAGKEHYTGKDMKHAAHFPAVLVEKYCNVHNITFEEFLHNDIHVRNMLNDPALSKLRIWEGSV